MANVDLSKLNKAVSEAEARTNSFKGDVPSIKWYKMAGTKARLRIMPPWTDEGDFKGQFWRVVHQHWGITDTLKAPIMCPKTTPFMEGDCPICDFVDELRAKNDVESKELVKSIRDKASYLFTVVDVDDAEYTAKDVAQFKKDFPDKKPSFSAGEPKLQVFAAPFTIYTQVLSLFQQGFDLVNLREGHDIVVNKQKKGGGNEFVSYTVNPTPRATDSNVPDNHPLVDLTKAGMIMQPSKVMELLTNGIAGDYEAGKALPSGAAKKVLESGDKRLAKAKASASKEVKSALAEDDLDDEELAYGSDSDDDSEDLEKSMLAGMDD